MFQAKITKWVLLGCGAILLIWDIIAQVTGGLKSTISWQIWEWTNEYAFLSFGVGFLAGHLFWPGQKWRELEKKPRD